MGPQDESKLLEEVKQALEIGSQYKAQKEEYEQVITKLTHLYGINKVPAPSFTLTLVLGLWATVAVLHTLSRFTSEKIVLVAAVITTFAFLILWIRYIYHAHVKTPLKEGNYSRVLT